MSKKIKVLHLDTEMTWRGGENQIRLLLEGLRDFPVENYLLAPPQSQAAQRLQTIAATRTASVRGLSIFNAAAAVLDWVREEGIQILDAHTSRAHQLGLLVKMRCPKVHLVVHRRVDYVPGSSWLNRWKYLTPKVSRYVAISQAIADGLIQYGIPPERVAVVKSAVDPSPFRALDRDQCRLRLVSELKLDPNLPWIVNAAYLTPQKGHDTLLKALSRLKQQNIPFVCLIAGDGELRESLAALHRQSDLGDSVRFLGIRSDVPMLLKACDILAMPSNYEGLGTTLLDGIYAGLCPVATAVGGIPEIVIDGETGLLSPAGDDAAHANNLRRVLEDTSLRQRLVQNAQRHAEEHFSLRSMVMGNLKVYQDILSNDTKRK